MRQDGGDPAGQPARPGTLGLELTDLVGRTAEIADIRRLLANARMVTIIGPGGVGKTRVALRAARQDMSQYADGVCLVELSALGDPGLLPHTVAESLGLARQETRDPLEAVLDYLCERQMLLILDTCEHLVEACAMFAEAVLTEAPDVSILVTSRQVLDLAGEHTYRLPPLPVPGGRDGARSRPGPSASSGDAVELFARRVAAVSPDFTVTPANWDDVVRVCRRLDGIPLAIELAAVRLRALSLRDLADRLDRSFDTLGSLRGGTERHQTLQTAIEWSYDLCPEAERELWARLSVFAGGFDLAAVEEVCAGRNLPRAETTDALFGLVDKSVVHRDGGRYRMLDTLREFGAEKLAQSGQERACRGRHVRYYLGLARDFEEHMLDHDQIRRLRALRTEHGNLRAAMGYALGSGDDQLVRDGAELASALHGYWRIAGLPREGRHWLAQALGKLPAGPSAERALALSVCGYLGPWAGELSAAVEETAEGAAIARSLGDEWLVARACLYQNIALMFHGQLDEALAIGEEARGRLKAVGDRTGLLILGTMMGHQHELMGDLPAAIEAGRRTLRGLREGSTNPETGEIGEEWLQSLCYIVIGLALHFTGSQEEATDSFSRALPLAYARDDIVTCGYSLEGLGLIAAAGQRWDRVAWLLGAADALWVQVGSRLGGNPVLEAMHEQMAGQARQALGDERFSASFAEGARYPLQELIERAAADADTLNPDGAAAPAAREPGHGGLTRREKEIAGLVAQGLSNREIAEKLVISVRTVDSHVEHIYTKLRISSRVQLAVSLRENGRLG